MVRIVGVARLRGRAVVVLAAVAATVLSLAATGAGRRAEAAVLRPATAVVAARATASSAADSLHTAAKAVDGDPGTGWRAAATDTAPSLQLDLGRLTWLTGVQQTFAGLDRWHFSLQASTDGAHWASLADHSAGAEGQTFAVPADGLFRYVRLTVTGSRSGAAASSQEIVVQGTSGGSDIAVGKPATASSVSDRHDASRAVDGDSSTYWQASGGSTSPPQILQVDLRSPSIVTGVEQDFKLYGTYGVSLQASLDGTKWTTLLDDSAGARGAAFSARASGTFRYVRVIIGSSAASIWPSSTELRVYGYTNLAQGRPVTTDSAAGGYPADLAVDADPSSYWVAADGAMPHWITVDLGGPTLLKRVSQAFGDVDDWSFTIEASTDDRTWTTLADDNAHGRVFTKNVSGTYRYVRMTVRHSGAGHWACSLDLQVLGAPLARDLAGGTSVTASSSIGADAPADAVDSDAATHWSAASTSLPQHLTVDLGNTSLLGRVEQTFADEGSWSFTLDGSVNGTTWKKLAASTATGTEFGIDVSGSDRYVRLTVTGAPAGKRASSAELRIIGTGSPMTSRWWQDSGPVKRYFPKEYHNTFTSITASLDTLRSQGFQTLELAPIYAGPAAPFAGLGATDNYAVDPTLGTMADFQALLKAAHARGMHIIFFGNLGYASIDAPFFKKAVADFAKGVDSTESQWFVLSHTGNGAGWYKYPGTDVYYYAYWGQPSPTYNWKNQAWRDEASKILRFWMGKGIDGIGLDAPLAYYGFNQELNNTYITDVLRDYAPSMMPEGISTTYSPVEQTAYEDMVSNYHYTTIQDLSINFWGDPSRNKIVPAMTDQDPSQLDLDFQRSRDAVTSVGGVQIEAPGWEADLTGTKPDPAKVVPADERLLEMATLTSAGGLFYLSNGTDAYQPEVQTIPSWTAAQKAALYRVLRAQNGDKALDPAGLRVKLPTNNNHKFYAFLRTDRTGAVKALVVLNYQKSAQHITVHLENTGISASQIPVDLLTGDAAAPITSGDYSVSLPAYGYTELAVR